MATAKITSSPGGTTIVPRWSPAVGVGVGEEVDVGVGVRVGEGVDVGVGVSVGEGVEVGVGVEVANRDFIEVGVMQAMEIPKTANEIKKRTVRMVWEREIDIGLS